MRRWNDVSVRLGAINDTFRLVFEAHRGNGDQGYTAIDDVTVRHLHGESQRISRAPLKALMPKRGMKLIIFTLGNFRAAIP